MQFESGYRHCVRSVLCSFFRHAPCAIVVNTCLRLALQEACQRIFGFGNMCCLGGKFPSVDNESDIIFFRFRSFCFSSPKAGKSHSPAFVCWALFARHGWHVSTAAIATLCRLVFRDTFQNCHLSRLMQERVEHARFRSGHAKRKGHGLFR